VHNQEAPVPAEKSSRFVQVYVGFLRDTTLSAEARWLGCVLATYANSEKRAWPGLKTLRRVTELGVNKLKSARAELVGRGYITRVQGREKRARFGSIKYEISTKILHKREDIGTRRAESKDAA
jgi:hypothetical protein